MASHLGLFCLPISHKKEARFIWGKSKFEINITCISHHSLSSWHSFPLANTAQSLVQPFYTFPIRLDQISHFQSKVVCILTAPI